MIKNLIARARSSRTRHLWLVGLCLYVAVMSLLGWRRVGATVFSLHGTPMACAALSFLTALWIRAAKWRMVLGGGKDAIRAFFISKAGGSLSPGRVGELAPLLWSEHRSTHMGAWILVDRLLEGGSTIGIGMAGLLVLGLPSVNLLAIFSIAAVVLVIAPFLVLRQARLFRWMASKTANGSRLNRFARMLDDIAGHIAGMSTRILIAAGMSVCATSMDLLTAQFTYAAFGYAVPFAVLSVAQCAHGIASVIPISPNASGLPYLASAGVLHELGAVPNEVLAAAISITVLMNLCLFWTSFAIGIQKRFK